MARAIWKGVIRLGKRELAVKLYTAVEDRVVHFRLLHAKDRQPVEQRIVRKSDGKEVPENERRKAFPIDSDTLVILQPDELESLEPEGSRDIDVLRFVVPSALSDQWYDRPYLVGPDGNEAEYFALAEAIERSGRIGIARWVMRKKRYVGALASGNGYLSVLTLLRAEQILMVDGGRLPKAQAPTEQELSLAAQLVQSVSADFDPMAWHDEHHEKVCALIEAKAAGRKVAAKAPRRKQETGDLAAALRKSVDARNKEKRVGGQK